VSSRRRVVVAGVLSVLVVSAAAYRWSYAHSRYYWGVEPPTLSCSTCHLRGAGGDLVDRLTAPRYRSPLNLALAPDERFLYVTAHEADALLEVDLETRRVSAAIPVGRRPHGVSLSPDGAMAYVTNERSDSVTVVDLRARAAVRSYAAGHEPAGIAVAADGATLFIASRGSDQITVLAADDGRELGRLAGGSAPSQVTLTPDAARLVVSNELSMLGTPGDPPRSELTVIDARSRRAVMRVALENAHLSAGVAVPPEGDLAFVALVQPKNLLPIIQVARGWVMTNGLGVVDLRSGRVVQVLLDEVDAYHADPFGVAVTPDGSHLFVTHSGGNSISVVSLPRLREVLAEFEADPELESFASRDLALSERYVVKRLETEANPKGIVVSRDGRMAYVAERLNDSILVVDVAALEAVDRIPLGGPTRVSAVRRGEVLFNNADATFQRQFTCKSCHPNNAVDRLQYDFEPDGPGRDILDNRSLLGISSTGPFKWNGRNTSMFMQCGIRFARILTRLEPFPPNDLAALVGFMASLTAPDNPHRAPDGRLTEAQERGRHFFERSVTKDGEPIPPGNRCITCHPPPLFTDRQLADVGTASPTSSVIAFDTPHLLNVYGTAPYLHDGRARTLEEIWTVFNPDDRHGVTRDMSKRDLNDLIDYLKTF
jgi:YVTN family beta-propeller protein